MINDRQVIGQKPPGPSRGARIKAVKPAPALDGDPGARSRPRLRRREKLADQVARMIEESILDGRLAPGEQLPIEIDIAASLNVSRTVVRDAIRALASRRLVDVRQGIGTTVTSPSTEAFAEAAYVLLLRSHSTVGDLLDARELLDTELIIGAMRVGGADWAPAEQALADYRSAIKDKRWEGTLEAHNRFHLCMMTALHNPVIDLLIAPMQEILVVTAPSPWSPSSPADWAKGYPDHPPILEAAQRGDENGLRKAVRAHYAYKDQPSFKRTRQQLLRKVAPIQSARNRGRSGGAANSGIWQLDHSPSGDGFLKRKRKSERSARV
jgi:GntR family transcriptional repressor for pyruvate dehydrogenase complex